MGSMRILHGLDMDCSNQDVFVSSALVVSQDVSVSSSGHSSGYHDGARNPVVVVLAYCCFESMITAAPTDRIVLDFTASHGCSGSVVM